MPNTLENILPTLRLLISEEILPLDSTFSDNCDLYEEGLDSLSLMQLIFQIEQKFNISVQPTDLGKENFQSLRSIAVMIIKKKTDE